MRGKVMLALLALITMSCSKEGPVSNRDLDYEYGQRLSHDKIVLGDRLENPYKTENITKALNELYPTKADRIDVKTTDLYVRFLPSTQEEYDALEALGLRLLDHPMDYAIAVEGDWYHDPDVPEGNITWQYAVVPADFQFPDIKYEIIDECHISEHDASTRSDDGIDWESVERQAYMLTGNENMLQPHTKASSKSVRPKGRITIQDKKYSNGNPIGVSGVKISCNAFVKYDDTHTDKNGYFEMSKKFNSDIRYRLIFDNKEKFSIGFNFVLVPASVSTLGTASPSGIKMTVTKDSEEKLYKRCVVNNAVYDYIHRCSASDLDVAPPPSGLRIWIFHNLAASSAVMLHHGAFLDNKLIKTFLGEYAGLVKVFLPDLTIGVKNSDEYGEIYSTTCHELAHASHFASVKEDYWDKYILYIMESFVTSGGKTYGNGSGDDAGYCEVGEMWAYYMESLMYKDRYGGEFPSFGNSYWFKPEILRYLHKKGFTAGDIYSVLDAETISLKTLERALIAEFPSKRSQIEQAFDKY